MIMAYIDMDDVKAYLDDKITECQAKRTELYQHPAVGLERETWAARLNMLEEIRKELEWIEVSGYTSKAVS